MFITLSVIVNEILFSSVQKQIFEVEDGCLILNIYSDTFAEYSLISVNRPRRNATCTSLHHDHELCEHLKCLYMYVCFF